MCGIAGILGRADRATVERMLDQQKHRGPDGRNIWTSPAGFTMGHDRLAIVDVEGGAQPLSNEDGTLWLAMNGEIYNHMALRSQLEGRHTFKTRSDSEVVLHLFEEYGPDCIKRLDGMFAIAIWGPAVGLFLARDPLGIKGLYWGRDEAGHLYFASEIKALVNEVPYVHEFPNGHYWHVGDSMVQYDAVPRPAMHLSEVETALDRLDETLTKAVVKRLMADVPVGCFLSGGLDSSLIAAIMRQHVSGEMHTFSVGLEGSEDLINARRVAADLGTIHHERVLTEREIITALPQVIDSLESCDPALVRSAIPTYFVSEMAARHVKVVLSGEGADELFAGYHYLTEFEPDWAALSSELHHITSGLHNSNLQRVDRMTMAHGLEGRVPFLDRAMLDLAFQMAPGLKRYRGEGKWILRKVAERYLSPAIVWRKKEKFAIGTGIGPLLQSYATGAVAEEQMAAERSLSGEPFRAKEEYLYWTLFKERYGREDVLSCMGRSRSLNPGERWVSAI
ncbi:MAG: asparagine synthase B [Bacillota bacterium]